MSPLTGVLRRVTQSEADEARGSVYAAAPVDKSSGHGPLETVSPRERRESRCSGES